MYETRLDSWLRDVKPSLAAEDYAHTVDLTESQIQLFMMDKRSVAILLDIAQSGDENMQIAACLFVGFLANVRVSVQHAPKILALVHNRALNDIHMPARRYVNVKMCVDSIASGGDSHEVAN